VLAPVLLVQAARLRQDAMRLPEATGRRFGSFSGHAEQLPVRLLFVGDSSAAGVGVAHQDEALAQPCAESLHRRTQKSVQWRLLAKSGITTAEAISLLDLQQLEPADFIITIVGVNDVTSQRTPHQFLADYQTLIRQLQLRTGALFGVINGIPPMESFAAIPNPLRWYLGRCAGRLDAHLSAWVATQPTLRHLPLRQWSETSALAADGYHPGPKQYRQWAERLAQCIAELLPSPPSDYAPIFHPNRR